MARPLRVLQAGGWYHVTGRGNERQRIFRAPKDYLHFEKCLAEMVERFRVVVHAYVLMPNHYHLMVETPEPNLSRAMQWLNVSYTVWFNLRYNRSGHLFQGRFKAIVVEPSQWAVALSRYVHLNPVRTKAHRLGKDDRAAARLGLAEKAPAELVRKRVATLQEYRWSSYRTYIGLSQAAPWLECTTILSRMGAKKQQASYRAYVEEAIREGLPERPWEELKSQLVLGSDEFLEKVRKLVKGNRREQPSLRKMEGRPSLDEIIGAVEAVKGEKWEKFRDRYGDRGRDVVLYLGRIEGGLKLGELTKAAGNVDYVSVSVAVRRFAQRAEKDESLRQLLNKVSDRLRKSHPPAERGEMKNAKMRPLTYWRSSRP